VEKKVALLLIGFFFAGENFAADFGQFFSASLR
jgi:hypothetical protein